MAANDSNLVDYLTLAAAILGPLAGVYTTLWTVRRGERVRFDAHVDWFDFGPNHPWGETPALYLHNKARDALVVTDIRFRTGIWIKRRRRGTALQYDDPMDLSFPYRVESGELMRLILADHHVQKYAVVDPWRQRIADFLRRPTLWIEIVSATGRAKTIPAVRALPWKERPPWAKIGSED